MHYCALGWKVIACLIPPAHMYGGIPCFLVALALIGVCRSLSLSLSLSLPPSLSLPLSPLSLSLVALALSGISR